MTSRGTPAIAVGLWLCIALALPGCRAKGTTERSAGAAEASVRLPVVADKFYPADAAALRKQVESYLNDAKPPALSGRIIAVLAPHAGYTYSGRVAGQAFAPLRGASYDDVIIVGPSHHVRVEGAALTDADAWSTPLGDVPVDRAACAALAKAWPQAAAQPAAFEQEHSVEVELPFLQAALKPGFKIVPIVMTDYSMANCRALAEALVKVADGRRSLLVASSDLSHFPPYATAQRSDQAALDAVLTLDAARVEKACAGLESEGLPGLETAMCGRGPVEAVMLAAKRLGADRAVLLGRANSGDADPKGRDRVVGYGAVALLGPAQAKEKPMERSPEANADAPLSQQQGERLLRIARESMERFVTDHVAPEVNETDPALTARSGAFVTLWKGGELRGCIGMLEAKEPLHLTVRDMAIAAASEDTRFIPVAPSELDGIRIEVSVLSPVRRVNGASQIVVGKHGVIVKQGGRQGVFLPEVAVQQKWSREEMLDNLCAHKAGLPRDAWKKGAELYCFTAQVFEEPGGTHGGA